MMCTPAFSFVVDLGIRVCSSRTTLVRLFDGLTFLLGGDGLVAARHLGELGGLIIVF